VRRGDWWYVAPLATTFEALVVAMRQFESDDIRDMVESFMGLGAGFAASEA
jgi:hypothetical protein